MREIGRYDSSLQMFIQDSKVRMKTLLFHRWVAENNRRTLSLPGGEFALALTITTGLPVDKAVDGAFNFSMIQSHEARLRQRISETGDY